MDLALEPGFGRTKRTPLRTAAIEVPTLRGSIGSGASHPLQFFRRVFCDPCDLHVPFFGLSDPWMLVHSFATLVPEEISNVI